MHRHKWSKWEVKQRQMTVATMGMLGRKEDVGKSFTQEYQERQCLVCGKTQRERVGP